MIILILFIGMIAWTYWNRKLTKHSKTEPKGMWMLVVAWFVVLIMGFYGVLK